MIRVVEKENIELKQHFAVDDNLVSRKDFIEWVNDKRAIDKLLKLQTLKLSKPVECTIQQEWVDSQKQVKAIKYDANNNDIYIDKNAGKDLMMKAMCIENAKGNVYINDDIFEKGVFYVSISGNVIDKITNVSLLNNGNYLEGYNIHSFKPIGEMVVRSFWNESCKLKIEKLNINKLRVSWISYIDTIRAKEKIVIENFKLLTQVECGNIIEFRKMEVIEIFESYAGTVIANHISIYNIRLKIFLLKSFNNGRVIISFIKQSQLYIERTEENTWSLEISMLGIDKGSKLLDIKKCLATDVYIDCGSVIQGVSQLNNKIYITFKDNKNTSKLADSVNGVARYVNVKVKFKEWKKNTCETELKKWIKECVFIINDTIKDRVKFEIDTTIEKGEKIISKIYNFSNKVINNGRVNKT